MESQRDTIYALSSAPGRSGVAVIRLTGIQAIETLRKITRMPLPEVRKMAVRTIWSPTEIIDEAMVVWFDVGASFTSEQMVELHTHGGRATVSSVLAALSEIPGLRSAEPGEFTRRAMESGRMDLVEVEALADLIDAETEEQRKQALSLMVGDGHAKATEWRGMFLQALALLEASIDFADEEDAPEDVSSKVSELLKTLKVELESAIDGSRSAARVRDGFRIALVGAPNVGKSTLMNALANRQAAITSPFAGTTRDIIEVHCDFKGYSVVLQDMAGIRDADDPVEKIGVTWALETAAAADLRLFLSSSDSAALDVEALEKPGDLQISTKADVLPVSGGFTVSAKTGLGLDRLVDLILSRIKAGSTVSSAFARERQLICLRSALGHVDICRQLDEPELIVENLRGGITEMNHLFGEIGNEEVFGEIFSQFCIGK